MRKRYLARRTASAAAFEVPLTLQGLQRFTRNGQQPRLTRQGFYRPFQCDVYHVWKGEMEFDPDYEETRIRALYDARAFQFLDPTLGPEWLDVQWQGGWQRQELAPKDGFVKLAFEWEQTS